MRRTIRLALLGAAATFLATLAGCHEGYHSYGGLAYRSRPRIQVHHYKHHHHHYRHRRPYYRYCD